MRPGLVVRCYWWTTRSVPETCDDPAAWLPAEGGDVNAVHLHRALLAFFLNLNRAGYDKVSGFRVCSADCRADRDDSDEFDAAKLLLEVGSDSGEQSARRVVIAGNQGFEKLPNDLRRHVVIAELSLSQAQVFIREVQMRGLGRDLVRQIEQAGVNRLIVLLEFYPAFVPIVAIAELVAFYTGHQLGDRIDGQNFAPAGMRTLNQICDCHDDRFGGFFDLHFNFALLFEFRYVRKGRSGIELLHYAVQLLLDVVGLGGGQYVLRFEPHPE